MSFDIPEQTGTWLTTLLSLLEDAPAVAILTIGAIKGSAPREPGATIFVTSDKQIGTIGGGSLEFDAIAFARQQMNKSSQGVNRLEKTFLLGPDLGQCCGGQVHLLIEIYHQDVIEDLQSLSKSGAPASFHDLTKETLPTPLSKAHISFHFDKQGKEMIRPLVQKTRPLYIYGAGHVGRALQNITSGLGFTRIWVDVEAQRFPTDPDPDITLVPARDMAVIAKNAPKDAYHIIVTYSHQIDEAICHALLSSGQYGRIGLIGSQTKKARFAKRLAEAGHNADQIADIICPIGLKEITSKDPAYVALSIAGQLAMWQEADS